jgi:hypothetical protein
VDRPVAGGLRPDGDGLVVGHFYLYFLFSDGGSAGADSQGYY